MCVSLTAQTAVVATSVLLESLSPSSRAVVVCMIDEAGSLIVKRFLTNNFISSNGSQKTLKHVSDT